MKKLINIMALMALLPISIFATDESFVQTGGGNNNIIGTLGNEAGLAYNRNYYLPVDVYGGKQVSAVVSYSSVTFANVVFSTAALTLATGNIAAPAHGFTNALPVLLVQTAGTLPVPLTTQTTYFAIRVDADNIKLATTSAQAVSNDPIIFISSTTTGTQTYTLSALANVGDPSFIFYGSNDGISYYSLGISSTPTVYNDAIWGYNFGYYNYSILKLGVTSPTSGSVRFKAVMNIKR